MWRSPRRTESARKESIHSVERNVSLVAITPSRSLSLTLHAPISVSSALVPPTLSNWSVSSRSPPFPSLSSAILTRPLAIAEDQRRQDRDRRCLRPDRLDRCDRLQDHHKRAALLSLQVSGQHRLHLRLSWKRAEGPPHGLLDLQARSPVQHRGHGHPHRQIRSSPSLFRF